MNRYLGIAFLFAALWFGSLQGESIKARVIATPQFNLEGIETIAIANFEESNPGDLFGKDLAGYITNAMVQASMGVGGGEFPLFQTLGNCASLKVVDQSQRDAIITQYEDQLRGLTGDAYAVKIGELAGVQGIITGTINYNFNDQNQSVGKGFLKVKAIERTVNVVINWRVLRVETEQIVAGNMVTVTCRSYKADNAVKDAIVAKFISNLNQDDLAPGNTFDVREAVQHLLQKSGVQVSAALATGTFPQELEIRRPSVDDNMRTCADRAMEAFENAKDAEDLEPAYKIFAGMAQSNPFAHELNYNLGVLSELVGNYSEAAEFYDLAAKTRKKETLYKDAAKRVEKVLTSPTLQSCLTPYAWPDVPEDVCAPMLVTLAGCVAYEEPDENANSVPIPADIEMTIIELAGEWFLVRLPNDMEWFVHKSKVKVQ
ncbi:MAG TPA: CsgG/HfaB family protein [Calditrichia bacterium]|nr:hypothetical protein [Calditrichota bacterium]HQU74341.1 CsgG/HfaB family protein [Calditrichia bacterium]HQV31033.1 CsgG/HfaB family protein [Calditrichia bacterium]